MLLRDRKYIAEHVELAETGSVASRIPQREARRHKGKPLQNRRWQGARWGCVDAVPVENATIRLVESDFARVGGLAELEVGLIHSSFEERIPSDLAYVEITSKELFDFEGVYLSNGDIIGETVRRFNEFLGSGCRLISCL